MNKYQKLFKELQKEKLEVPSHYNDNIVIFDGLNTFIRSFYSSLNLPKQMHLRILTSVDLVAPLC